MSASILPANLPEPQPPQQQLQTTGHHQIGVSAQQLQKHFPMLVFGDDTETNRLSVDYSHMSAIFFSAIKELKEIQDARISELEKQIELLTK